MLTSLHLGIIFNERCRAESQKETLIRASSIRLVLSVGVGLHLKVAAAGLIMPQVKCTEAKLSLAAGLAWPGLAWPMMHCIIPYAICN